MSLDVATGGELAVALHAPLGLEDAVRVELLHAMIPGVGNIHGAIRSNGHTPGFIECADGSVAAQLVGNRERPQFRDLVAPEFDPVGSVLIARP